MGMAVFSGMLVATIIGVCLIPVLFVLVERVIGKTHAPMGAVTPPKLATEHGGTDH